MSHPSKLPTLDDVAAAAGVSTATVSRCLNTPEKVSEDTRSKVLQTVKKLGYTPHFGARAMAVRRTFTIGAIIPTMDNAIFARGIQAFQEQLHDLGYTLLVASYAYRPDLEEEQIKALIARGADGLLLIGYERDPAIYADLKRRGIPALVAWAYRPAGPVPSVGFDNRAAMKTLARKVLAKGHRRIGVISGILAGNDRAAGRLQGIREAMAEGGLDPESLTVIETPYEIENGAEAFGRILQNSPDCTVIMCSNDVLAVGALQKAQALGLRVPGDISVTGFDDIELARIAQPPLTTMHVPHGEMGKNAALALVQMIDQPDAHADKELPVELKVRDTLGAPRRNVHLPLSPQA